MGENVEFQSNGETHHSLNRLTFNDADEVRALFSELIGKKVDESFVLIPPFYTAGGVEISVGHNVFVNQNCTFMISAASTSRTT